MKYGITDLAEILGITTSAIRYFEKEHLIQAEKTSSGRRNYNEEDIFRLLSYTKYRNMEIPMKTIITQFSGEENDRTLIGTRIAAAKEKALEKARYYQQLAADIEGHENSIAQIEGLLGNYEFVKAPAALIAQTDGCGWITKDRRIQDIVRKWVEQMPSVHLVAVDGENTRDFGYMIPPGHPAAARLPMDLNILTCPSASSLHTIVRAPEDFAYHPKEIFRAPYAYARERRLEVCGISWGQILLVEVEKGQHLHTYVELWIPIC